MKNNALVLFGLVLSCSTNLNFAQADSSTANPPSTTPTPVIARPIDSRVMATKPGPSPALTATPLPVLDESEKKKLLSEFQKAMSDQRSALAHQEKSSMKELTSVQSMKKKKWLVDQKRDRHQFFDTHMSGPERRQYVQDYQKKLQDFDAAIKTETATAKKNWADRAVALKQTQKEQETKFNTSLSQGIRPAINLWPAGN